MEEVCIRKIAAEDNEATAKMIREVLVEFNVPKTGTAYADKALDMMFETYAEARMAYFVIEEKGKIIGSAGIAPLADFEAQDQVCELQKMYFLPEARGRGLGKAMMEICLQQAKDFGFSQCYLETMPNMDAAQVLYRRSGFHYIDAPMGNTGHFSCPVWMLKKL